MGEKRSVREHGTPSVLIGVSCTVRDATSENIVLGQDGVLM